MFHYLMRIIFLVRQPADTEVIPDLVRTLGMKKTSSN